MEPCVASFPYTISILRKDQVESAMLVLTETWIDMEPLEVWLKNTQDKLYKSLLDMQFSSLDPILSAIATDNGGNIVGVGIAYEFSLTKADIRTDPMSSLTAGLNDIYRETFRAEKREGKIACVYGMGVLNSAKGKGIAKYIMKEIMHNAANLGYKWLMTVISNIYTSRTVKTYGFRKIAEIDYEDFEYVDSNGVKSKPFAGVNKWFTEFLNFRRGAGRELEDAAKSFELYDCEVDHILETYNLP